MTLSMYATRAEKFDIDDPRSAAWDGSENVRLSLYSSTLDLMKEYGVKDGDKILEVGTGTGLFCRYLADEMPGVNYYGIEAVTEALEAFLTRYPGMKSRVAVSSFPDLGEIAKYGPFDFIVFVGNLRDQGSRVGTYEVVSKAYESASKGVVGSAYTSEDTCYMFDYVLTDVDMKAIGKMVAGDCLYRRSLGDMSMVGIRR